MAETLNVKGPEDLGDFHAALRANLKRVQEDPEYLASLTEETVGNPITLGPRVVSAEAWVEDMTTAAKAKAKKWLDRSLKPKKDPKARAKAASTKWRNKMMEAIEQGYWDDAIDAYDEALRMETIKDVGETGYRTGIDSHKKKADAKIKKLQPLVLALADTIDQMPVDTPEQRAAKMVAARDGMLEVKKQMRK